MTMMPLGEAFYRGRVQAIREQVLASGAKGILLLNMPDVVYASGFVHSPSERPIGLFVPASGEPVLLIPLLEQENAAETWIKDIRVYFEFPGTETVLDWMVAQCDVNPLLVESNGSAWWRPEVPFATPTNILNRLRWVKQPEELACIRLAAHYADLCLSHVRDQAPPIIRRGGSELNILEASISATLRQMRDELGSRYAPAAC